MCFWFIELEEELGSAKSLYVSFALPNSGGALPDRTFSFSGVGSSRSCRFCFANSHRGAGLRSSTAVGHRIEE